MISVVQFHFYCVVRGLRAALCFFNAAGQHPLPPCQISACFVRWLDSIHVASKAIVLLWFSIRSSCFLVSVFSDVSPYVCTDY